MELEKTIRADLNSAMLAKKELEVSVLRQILATAQNKEKEKKFKSDGGEVHLTEEELLEVVLLEAKKRRESIELFTQGNRPALADKEKAELAILEKYMPEQMNQEDVRKLATEIITKTGAKEIKDMGQVMAELSPKIKGRVDGSLAGKIVKELLLGK